ncbi:MAG: DUF5906 domain-containing protein [Acinetobacter sp.]
MNLDFAKRYAKQGYFVFPTYRGRQGQQMKPFGWALNQLDDLSKKAKAIPATILELEIDQWSEKLKQHYNTEITGFGVLGRGIIILDLDVKKGKDGANQYEILRNQFKIPPCKFIVRTRSGGFHLYFKKPKKYKDTHVKSMVNVNVAGHVYDGIDIRGDGGFVQGPNREGDWEPDSYTITKGGPEVELTELPEDLILYFLGASTTTDLDSLMAVEVNAAKANDMLSVLRRGELPEIIPDGQRNEAFFVFVNALKAKGLDREVAKVMCLELAKRCEHPETLMLSVNIDDMLDRVFEKSIDNPYDIGLDLVQRGLYMLTGHGSKPKYVILNENPYIRATTPHDLNSMKEMMLRYTRSVTGPDGKTKSVNPMEIAVKRIPPDQIVDTIGFKAVDVPVYQMNMGQGTRFLNTYQKPYVPDVPTNTRAFEEFKILLTRIFGPEGSPDFQLGLDFCAWFIQKPTIKPAISIYLISEKRGVGKSLFLNLMTYLLGVNKLGERQGRVRNLTDLTKRFFNPTGCLLNIVDEVQFSVHKNMRQESAEFWRVLKNLVTANTLEIEIKNGGSFNVVNTAGLILAGNKGSRFPIEEYDRRLWIIDNNAQVMNVGTVDMLYSIANDTTQFTPTEKIQGIESIRWFLNQHEIVNDLSTIRAPMTAVKEEMYRASMTDEEEWFLDYFSNRSNLLAATPIISKSAFLYIISAHPEIPSERWRENAAHMFREAIRRGHLKAVKRESGTNIQFTESFGVTTMGDVYRLNKSDTLYMTRDFEEMAKLSKSEIFNLFRVNLASISQYKTEALNRKESVTTADLSDLRIVENQ